MKKFRKFAAAAIALCLALSAAACGQPGGGGVVPPPAVEVDEALMKPFAPYPQPITLTTARHMNRGNQFAEGEDIQHNVYLDVIKEKLNVNVVVEWETDPGDSYNQKLALSIAGDTLPDVFGIAGTEYLLLQQLVRDGKLADLTDAYNKCVGGVAKELLDAMDGSQNTMAIFNGRLMAVPQPPTGYNYNQLWVRGDWLEKVRMDPPKTLDEVKRAALAFMDAKLGGENTVGIIVDPQTFYGRSESFLSLSMVANACGAYPQDWIAGPDGKALWGSVAPAMKDALAVAAEWYRLGILDPQWMTYPNMDAVTPATRDEERCGMFFGAYWSPWVVPAKFNWIPVFGPVDKNGNYNHVNDNSPNSFTCVSAKCANPEAVIKAKNIVMEMDAGVYDNEPHIKAAIDKSRAAGSYGRTIDPFSGSGQLANDFRKELNMGIALENFIRTGNLVMFPGATDSDRQNIMKAYDWQAADPRDYTSVSVPEGYALYHSYMTMFQLSQLPKNHDEPVLYRYTTDSMADYWQSLQTLEKEMITQIVSGQKPLEFFDEFVARWKSSGGDKITEEVNAVLANLK
jgi:putative aldouronate transport system substrate-binding protein